MNYNVLKNIREINYFKIILLVFIIIFISVLITMFIKINVSNTYSGIYNNNVINLKIERNQLSEIIKNKKLLINKEEVLINNIEINNYEIIDDNIFGNILITVDKSFINNEILDIEVVNKERLLYYILKLFK